MVNILVHFKILNISQNFIVLFFHTGNVSLYFVKRMQIITISKLTIATVPFEVSYKILYCLTAGIDLTTAIQMTNICNIFNCYVIFKEIFFLYFCLFKTHHNNKILQKLVIIIIAILI